MQRCLHKRPPLALKGARACSCSTVHCLDATHDTLLPRPACLRDTICTCHFVLVLHNAAPWCHSRHLLLSVCSLDSSCARPAGPAAGVPRQAARGAGHCGGRGRGGRRGVHRGVCACHLPLPAILHGGGGVHQCLLGGQDIRGARLCEGRKMTSAAPSP